MRFWGSYSWVYFAGIILIVASLVIEKILKLLSERSENHKLNCLYLNFSFNWMSIFIASGIVFSMLSCIAFALNLCDYNDQKTFYESGYECIVNYIDNNKDLLEENAPDVLEEALKINSKYFEIKDGEMKPNEFYFRYITDDSWKTLKPINTNEIIKKVK